jgi:hypothetical protein
MRERKKQKGRVAILLGGFLVFWGGGSGGEKGEVGFDNDIVFG